ncbi:hypothetical protein HDU81_009731 [Chytriomyces hyalinus]|nr:hypothetical protein HDU81_009731 [Chytriomyces hyalinus]
MPTKKYLGARPDPHPEIPAAGAAKIDVEKIADASDCLDHGDRTISTKRPSRWGEPAHIPGKLPKNITSLTDKARPMTHGVQHVSGPDAGTVLFPKQPHPLLQERENRRERIYHRREHQVLGKSIDHEHKLPAFTTHPDFRFGMSSFEDDSVKNIMYPAPIQPTPDDEKIRKQYLLSHWSYGPGEHREHYGDFRVPEHKLLPDNHDNNGLRVKEILHWSEERAKESQTKIVSKRQTDWRRRRQPKLGTVHDPLAETMSHLPPDHIFGIRFPSDDYNIGDLLGSGAKVQAEAREKLKAEEEEKLRGTANLTDSKQIRGRRAMAQARHDAQEGDITSKITSIPFESDKSEKALQQVIFGLPTVRSRNPAFRPGFFKKLADNTNYGDELDTKSLLSPTPRNMYGDDILDQYFKEMHLESPSLKPASLPRLHPAKLQPVMG